MIRIIEKANAKTIIKLLKKINLGIQSMIYDYTSLYSSEEIVIFNNILKIIDNQIKKVLDNKYTKEEVYMILEYEDYLKPYIFRCWDFEVKNGCQYISWFKRDKLADMPPIVSSTFFNDEINTFCKSSYGINYAVFIDGFLGACEKDAATLIEDSSKQSIYTIGKTDEDKIINSYNLATVVVTPMQIFNNTLTSERQKYNEIILDSRYIMPISAIYINDNYLDMVNFISAKYNVPIQFKKILKK